MSLRSLLAASAGLLALAVAVAAVVVLPWIRLPDEPTAAIDRRWEQIQAWAAPSAETGASRARLDQALAAWGRSDARERLDREPVPGAPIDPTALDRPAQAARHALILWAGEEGGLGEDPCLREPSGRPAPPPIAAYGLAKLALATATSAEDPALVAALRLGAHLRGRGGLLPGLVGGRIAGDALEVVQARGYAITPALRELAPRAEEAFGMAARDAICTERLLDDPEGSAALVDDSGGGGLAGWIGERVGVERERAWLRHVEGQRLEAAYRVRGDVSAVAAALALPEDPEALPASLLVRAAVSRPEGPLRRYAAIVDAFAAIAGERAASRPGPGGG